MMLVRVSLALMLAIVVSACATSQQLSEQREKGLANLRAMILADIRKVVPYVKPEHLEKCRNLLRNRGHVFGGSFRVISELKPALRHSCAAHQRSIFASEFDGIAAYVATIQYISVGGEKGFKMVAACVFELKSEKIEVYAGKNQGVATNPCHHI